MPVAESQRLRSWCSSVQRAGCSHSFGGSSHSVRHRGQPGEHAHRQWEPYYLTDNQGSVIGLVDGQGQKVAGYSYDPYGATRTITGTATGDLTKPTRIPTATPAATATTTAASTSSATATTTPSRAASPNRTPPARRATCSPTPVATQSISRTSQANRF